MVGLPFHLWNEENFLELSECVGEPMAVDLNNIVMVKLDYARSDGLKEY